jgi:hypothetical protein
MDLYIVFGFLDRIEPSLMTPRYPSIGSLIPLPSRRELEKYISENPLISIMNTWNLEQSFY